MSKRHWLGIAGSFLVAGLGFMNCSKTAFLLKDDFSSGDIGKLNDPPVTYSQRVAVVQDQSFQIQIKDFTAGNSVTAENLPSWMQLNAATGTLTGVPPDLASVEGVILRLNSGSILTKGSLAFDVTGDPLKKHQWHLQNTGQTNFAGLPGIAGHDLKLTQTIASKILGAGVRVAVSDSGVFEAHRGLAPNLLAGESRNYLLDYPTTKWIGNSTPATSVAANAHGTAVAGLIAERGWLGIGGRGVAPLAKFAGFLFVPAQEKLLADGLLTAGGLDQYAGNFDIFNYSWGDPQCVLLEYDQATKDKIKAGTVAGRGGKGVIYVKAAGNDYAVQTGICDPLAPDTAYVLGNGNYSEEATTPYIIMVAAVTAEGKSASYSSPGSNLWIASPGGEYGFVRAPAGVTSQTPLKPAVLAPDYPGCNLGLKSLSAAYNDFDAGQDPNTNCEHTATMNGTSASSPIAAGAIALILSANQNLTWRDIKHILASTSDQVDPGRVNTAHPVATDNIPGYVYEPGWTTNAAGFKFHNWYGFGRVNVDKAVQMALSYTVNLGTFKETNSGSTWKYSTGAIAISVPGGNATGVTRTFAVSENYTIEGVQVRINAKDCIGNVAIELVSPAGTKSVVQNINNYLPDSEILDHVYLSNLFYGEKSPGTWTVRLVGGKSGCNSNWRGAQLNILGR